MQKLSARSSLVLIASLTLLAFTGCTKAARRDRHMQQANTAVAAGKFDEAEIQFKNVLQVDPNNGQAIGQLGVIYFKEGRVARAVAFLLKGRELQPGNLDLRNEVGTAFLSAGKLAEARQEALFVLQNRPADSLAPIILAKSIRTGEEAQAARSALQALPAGPTNAEAIAVGKGLIAMRAGNIAEAEARLNEALSRNPNSAEAHAALGAIYISKNDLARGETEIAAAAKFSPPRSGRKLQYAQFKFQQGDNPASRKILNEIISATPDYLPASIALAEIDFGEKKYADSSALLAKVAARETVQPDAILLRARILIAQSEGSKAVAELEQMVAGFPQFAPAFYYLGTAYIMTGQLPKAVTSLTEAVRLAPSYADAVLLLANLNVARGNLLAAQSSLENLLRQSPNLIQGRIQLADVLVREGNFAGARAAYDQAAKLMPGDAQLDVLRGQTYLRENNPANATLNFNHALQVSPFYRPAEEELVALEMRQRNFEAARTRVVAVLAHDPAQSWAQLLLGRILITQNKMDEAEEVLRKLTLRDPDIAEAYLLLAGIYSAKHEEGKALASLRDTTQKDPKNFPGFMLLALLSERNKNFPEARAAYEKALALNPNSGAALNNLAYMYSEHFNELDKAYAAAQRARAALPLDPGVEDTLGWILFKKKQYSDALGLLRESAGKLTTSADVQYHLGQALAVTGNENEAKAALARALSIDAAFDGNVAARQRLKLLSSNSSDQSPASLGRLESEAKLAPDDPVLGLRLALLYNKTGAFAKAQDTYESLVRTNPQNPAVALALIAFYSEHSQQGKALDLAKATRKQFPNNDDVDYSVGKLLLATGDYAGAFSILQDVRRDLGSDPEVAYDFAVASFYNGQVPDALEAIDRALAGTTGFSRTDEAKNFKRLVELTGRPAESGAETAFVNGYMKANPDSLISLLLRAGQEERTANASAASAALTEILKRVPTFLPAYRSQAMALATTRSADDASLRVAVKARTYFPDDPKVAKAYGALLYLHSDFPLAISLLKEAAAKLPGDGEIYYYLGNAEVKSGQSKDGLADLNTALKLGVGEPFASEIRKSSTK